NLAGSTGDRACECCEEHHRPIAVCTRVAAVDDCAVRTEQQDAELTQALLQLSACQLEQRMLRCGLRLEAGEPLVAERSQRCDLFVCVCQFPAYDGITD